MSTYHTFGTLNYSRSSFLMSSSVLPGLLKLALFCQVQSTSVTKSRLMARST